jgi:hypothetical protein
MSTSTPSPSAPGDSSTGQSDPQFAFDQLETVDIYSIPESNLPRTLAALGALRNEYIYQNKGQKKVASITRRIREINSLIKPPRPTDEA